MTPNKTAKLILLIDDDAGTNFINQRLLEIQNIGDEIRTFTEASEGLLYIESAYNTEKKIASVILLDLRMPEIDGFEFLKRFRNLPEEIKSKTKIIVLSSTEIESEISEIKKDEHVVGFYSKPLPNEGLELIKSLLNK